MKPFAIVLAALALPFCVVSTSLAGPSQGTPANEANTIKKLVVSAAHHRLPVVMGVFTSDVILRVYKREWRGSQAVRAWWRLEFAHGLRLAPLSKIQFRGTSVVALLNRITNKDCSRGCIEQATWHFRGSRISRMSLSAVQPPPAPSGVPGTVPLPPTSPPPPHVTPTIPT